MIPYMNILIQIGNAAGNATHESDFDWQLWIVIAILIFIIGWIIYRIFFRKGPVKSSCCGCALASTCSDPKKKAREAHNEKPENEKCPDCCKK